MTTRDGLGEGGLGRRGVAHVIVPVEDDVAGNVVEQLRRARGDRILGLGDRRQLIVFDLDGFSGIACGAETLGDDQRHRLTDMSNLAERKHGPRGVVPWRTVATDQRHHAGHVAEAVRPNVLAGGHKQHPGMRRAAVASMRLIRACATGARRTKACVIRGRVMSSV